MSDKDNSGWIYLKNDDIVYRSPEEAVWELPISELRVIGEFTNSHGPVLDDYFFIFLTKDASVTFWASFYADGREEFLKGLSKRLCHELTCDLVSSTNLKSRVMWPQKLEGKPIFEFLPEESAKNFIGSIRQKIMPKTITCLTKEVREAIEGQTGKSLI